MEYAKKTKTTIWDEVFWSSKELKRCSELTLFLCTYTQYCEERFFKGKHKLTMSDYFAIAVYVRFCLEYRERLSLSSIREARQIAYMCINEWNLNREPERFYHHAHDREISCLIRSVRTYIYKERYKSDPLVNIDKDLKMADMKYWKVIYKYTNGEVPRDFSSHAELVMELLSSKKELSQVIGDKE